MIRNVLGSLLLLIGIAGLLLPFIPGWLFFFLGVSMLTFAGKVRLIANIKKLPVIRHISRWYEQWKHSAQRSSRHAARRAKRLMRR